MLSLSTLVAVAALSATALADPPAACGNGQQCGSDLPCCSQYGQCGVGAYCLGGCDPLSSHSLDSCVPAPVCSSADYKFSSLDGITPNTQYLGDSSKTKWVSDGAPTPYQDSVLLTMAQGTVGTLLASSAYVWYGKVSATLKTSRGAGVVTAFILLSDVKDEIDFEFVGADLTDVQSNYYFQGVTDYNNAENVTLSDTFDNYHTYTIDWQPDQLTWSVDGQVGRTLKRSDTFNKTANQYYYPQTPARVQLSLWPAGLSSNGPGTVAWAGGLIDWNSQDIKSNGYYYASVQEVNVQCYDPPSGVNKTGDTSYIYDGDAGTSDTVAISNKQTVLKSLLGTGTNMNAGDPSQSSASGTATAGASASSQPATVPGLSGAGTGGTSSEHGTGSSGGGSGGGGAAGAAGPVPTGFSQGPVNAGGNAGTTSKSDAPGQLRLQGSFFACLIAMVGVSLL